MKLAAILLILLVGSLALAILTTPKVPRNVPLNVAIVESEEPLTYQHHELRCSSLAPPVPNQLCARGRWTQGI